MNDESEIKNLEKDKKVLIKEYKKKIKGLKSMSKSIDDVEVMDSLIKNAEKVCMDARENGIEEKYIKKGENFIKKMMKKNKKLEYIKNPMEQLEEDLDETSLFDK